MYTKQQINELYERAAAVIDISEELFDKAKDEYKSLGRWIDEKTPNYKIQVYPQGSFALGTVVKPYTDDDEYDLDLVCEFEERYNLSAKQLKVDVVKPLLAGYAKTTTDIKEKRRCWQVEYLHIKGFHMDVIPAVLNGQYILITDKDEDALMYDYIGSNPKGYIDWFNSRKKVRYERIKERYILNESQRICCQAEIVELKEYRLKTPLQKAIQLLKRHRDIMFAADQTNSAPISIIITTLVAQLYNNEDNIFDTLHAFLFGAEAYINAKKNGTEYHIDNPSYTGTETENFADKWNKHPERASAFFNWLRKAREDFVGESLINMTRIQMGESMNRVLGSNTTQRIFNEIADQEKKLIIDQTAKIITSTGAISTSGTIPVMRNHHHGQ